MHNALWSTRGVEGSRGPASSGLRSHEVETPREMERGRAVGILGSRRAAAALASADDMLDGAGEDTVHRGEETLSSEVCAQYVVGEDSGMRHEFR